MKRHPPSSHHVPSTDTTGQARIAEIDAFKLATSKPSLLLSRARPEAYGVSWDEETDIFGFVQQILHQLCDVVVTRIEGSECQVSSVPSIFRQASLENVRNFNAGIYGKSNGVANLSRFGGEVINQNPLHSFTGLYSKDDLQVGTLDMDSQMSKNSSVLTEVYNKPCSVQSTLQSIVGEPLSFCTKELEEHNKSDIGSKKRKFDSVGMLLDAKHAKMVEMGPGTASITRLYVADLELNQTAVKPCKVIAHYGQEDVAALVASLEANSNSCRDDMFGKSKPVSSSKDADVYGTQSFDSKSGKADLLCFADEDDSLFSRCASKADASDSFLLDYTGTYYASSAYVDEDNVGEELDERGSSVDEDSSSVDEGSSSFDENDYPDKEESLGLAHIDQSFLVDVSNTSVIPEESSDSCAAESGSEAENGQKSNYASNLKCETYIKDSGSEKHLPKAHVRHRKSKRDVAMLQESKAPGAGKTVSSEKRLGFRRKNIRGVYNESKLGSATLQMRQKEQERLARLGVASSSTSDAEQPLLDKRSADIICINSDSDEELPPGKSNLNLGPAAKLLDWHRKPLSPAEICVLSSDSDDESDVKSNDDIDLPVQPSEYYSELGLHANDSLNVSDSTGKILINVNHSTRDDDIFLPPHLAKRMKPHQIGGVRFMYDNLIESIHGFRRKEGCGCILAHAMGLGKTMQTIAFIDIFLRYTPSFKVLCVVPVNTIQNWMAEFNYWLPSKPVMLTPLERLATLKQSMKRDKKKGKSSSVDQVVQDVVGDLVDDVVLLESVFHELQLENTIGTGSFNGGTGCTSLDCSGNLDLPIESLSGEDFTYLDCSVPKPALQNNTMCDQAASETFKSRRSSFLTNAHRVDASQDELDHHGLSTELNDHEAACGGRKTSTSATCYRQFKVFQVDAQKSPTERSKIIGNWETCGGVLLIGYEMYRSLALSSAKFGKGKKGKVPEDDQALRRAVCQPGPDLVVCDEGHRIRNYQSGISVALKSIRTKKRLVLTGYPLQNNLIEYWCMVDFVRPHYLGSRLEFANMFERPIMNGQCFDSTQKDKHLMRQRVHVLYSLLQGFVQRRGHDVLKNVLPSKSEHVIMVRMSSVQKALYMRLMELTRLVYNESLNPVKTFGLCCKIWNHPDILYKAVQAELEGQKMDIISDEDDITVDDVGGMRKRKKRALNVQKVSDATSLPSFDSDMSSSRSLLDDMSSWAGPVFRSFPFMPGLIENSGKMVVLNAIISEVMAAGDKLLIFSQSLLTLDKIEEFFSHSPLPDADDRCWKKGRDYYRLDGSTSAIERERLINSFNSKDNKETRIFLLSTRAGCLGINLVGANRVVVFDVSWNPCYDAQAVCRIYRYGQEKKCYIYRLVSSNTMEKKIYYRQISKQGISNRVVDEMSLTENFSRSEIASLVIEESDNEPVLDLTQKANVYKDPVLRNVLKAVSMWITKEPFKHESLLINESREKLSGKEKQEAKRAYQAELEIVQAGGTLSNYRPSPLQSSFPSNPPVAPVRPFSWRPPIHSALSQHGMYDGIVNGSYMPHILSDVSVRGIGFNRAPFHRLESFPVDQSRPRELLSLLTNVNSVASRQPTHDAHGFLPVSSQQPTGPEELCPTDSPSFQYSEYAPSSGYDETSSSSDQLPSSTAAEQHKLSFLGYPIDRVISTFSRSDGAPSDSSNTDGYMEPASAISSATNLPLSSGVSKSIFKGSLSDALHRSRVGAAADAFRDRLPSGYGQRVGVAADMGSRYAMEEDLHSLPTVFPLRQPGPADYNAWPTPSVLSAAPRPYREDRNTIVLDDSDDD